MFRVRVLALLAPLGVAFGAGGVAVAEQRMAQCPAASRDKPTLNRKRLPTARFRMVTDAVGWERDAAGVQHELFLRHGVETAELERGVRLRVRLGGCETYSNAYEFVIPGVHPSDADGAHWLRVGSKLLRQVAVANMDEIVPLTALADALARKAHEPAAAQTLAQEGLDGKIEGRGEASYRVEIKQSAGKTTLTVRYSVPL